MQNDNLQRFINDLIAGSAYPDKQYIIDMYTYADIYAIATGFTATFKNRHMAVCICTENKGIIMAAIVAALCSNISLIFPYAFSTQVLQETREVTGFTAIISENQEIFLEETEKLPIQKSNDNHLELRKDLHTEFLTLFTGGSTGKPKIWTKTVGNIFAEIFYLKHKFNINKDDIFIATVPPYHIYGLLFSVIMPFAVYASILPEIYIFPQEIVSMIQKQKATLLISVPMHYRTLRTININSHSLRLAFSSAGALDKNDADAFYKNTKTAIYEIYGSTETGGIATRCRAKGENGLTAFDDLNWKIYDERLQVKSEYISPELPTDAEGFFTTGDQVTKINERSFMLVGRADGIVKVAGKRVDLADIQNKLQTVAGITDLYVTSLPVQHGRENEIIAIVEGNIDEKTIRKEAKKILEPYAIPKKIQIVAKIPRTKTGKYDSQGINKLFNK